MYGRQVGWGGGGGGGGSGVAGLHRGGRGALEFSLPRKVPPQQIFVSAQCRDV